jgi:hypothetical protein
LYNTKNQIYLREGPVLNIILMHLNSSASSDYFMAILSLRLTVITETEVVHRFVQVRFEVLPVMAMKTLSSGM